MLTGLQLAHAVIKADRVRRLPFEWLAGLAFLMEHLPTFDWREDNLRLFDGISQAYADFTGSSLSGRVGQGLALLLMEQMGFRFVGQYPRPPSGPRPDFIVESSGPSGHRALVESKGSFVRRDDRHNIKGVLNEGLVQVTGVAPHGATKSFVVGSFLREAGDKSNEPSLVSFLDPESNGNVQSDRLPPDWVVRQNYAAWLDAMGLHEAASDVRRGRVGAKGEQARLKVIALKGVDYAITPLVPWITVDPWLSPEVLMLRDPELRVPVAGLRTSVVEVLKRSLRDTSGVLDHPDLLAGNPQESVPFESKGGYGSPMADGSLLALVPARELWRGGEEMML
ncbi:MAG: hypothetical protein M0038_16900 [Pseudomonadota bacterium]|jgi:hypothetical protein|nr:hypothetical protein [Pseudomonadota bacterium]